ncbi:BON domain-containing protein [filamentous cyanobacterium LEGE 11480]|uniref:BON domain-containing protein n=1 Tax=Romeriopsis navalis LEGE 11480 TaxID=2777977 RepID=A0A928Z2H9_9CYAN|nr:BON domain-containing protein [Romeriopsis navalis]MBE9030406.1 BON domain-containing protein [Romeriopsis navalis LEGE 11480]
MGWLDRMFGGDKKDEAQAAPADAPTEIPPERMGLNGEYDQSGLAKRVAQAFDENPALDDIATVWVAQTGSSVVLKGKVPSQDMLNSLVSVASGVNGASSVNTDQVEIG